MGRHKGAEPFVHTQVAYGSTHPVAHMIATGSHWFDAWVMQCSTPFVVLSRKSKVSVGRIAAISSGDVITRSELEAFAQVWHVEPSDLIASLPSATLLVE